MCAQYVRSTCTYLLYHDIDLILLVQIEHLRGVVAMDLLATPKEAKTAYMHTFVHSESIKDSLHWGALFDAENEVYAFTLFSVGGVRYQSVRVRERTFQPPQPVVFKNAQYLHIVPRGARGAEW